MKKIKEWLNLYFPTKISAFGYFLAFLQFFYLYQVIASNDVGGISFSVSSFIFILLSLFTVVLVYQSLSALCRTRWSIISLSVAILLLFDVLVAYQFGANELLNWSVIADNFSSAFTRESVTVMMGNLDEGALYYFPIFCLIFFYYEYKKQSISKGIQNKPRVIKFLSGIILYIVIAALPIDSYDPMLNFFRSAFNHYTSEFDTNIEISDNEYPLIKEKNKLSNSVNFNEKPNVFLILVESLNASSIDKVARNGKAYTPFLNQLKNNSIYVEKFYANSVQTAKGHFAILFSMIPSITGKAYTKYKDLNVESIATVLSREGYDTTFFAAHKSRSFDNNQGFVTSHGFDVFDRARPYLTEEQLAKRFRWGIEDSVFYEVFFKYFDEKLKNRTKPQFITLPTIANHFPFSISEERKLLLSDAKGIKEDYANSVHLVDLGIQNFFKELKKRGLDKNSIVIITGDHSYPLGEHGNYHLEAGYHEESFRVPFFLVWDGKLKPKKIKEVHSQLDIAPTILDLLNIEAKNNNFQGQSIFVPDQKDSVYLIQPYGKHFSIVDYPIKYRLSTKTNKEYAYNLELDPMEIKNIFSKLTPEQKQHYRSKINHIYLNQYLIKNNLLRP